MSAPLPRSKLIALICKTDKSYKESYLNKMKDTIFFNQTSKGIKILLLIGVLLLLQYCSYGQDGDSCIHLDGNSRVQLNFSTTSDSTILMECWIKLDTITNIGSGHTYAAIFGSTNGAYKGIGIRFQNTTKSIFEIQKFNGSWFPDTNINVNNLLHMWHHIGVYYYYNSYQEHISFYYDTLEIDNFFTNQTYGDNIIYVGNNSNNDGLIGQIDEVRIWNKYLLIDSVRRFMDTTFTHLPRPNLMGYWKFNGNISDSSGHANTAINTNATFVSSSCPVWYEHYVVGLNQNLSQISHSFSVSQNYPNPFNPTTKIKYDLQKQADIKLTIYDITGKEVYDLVNSEQQPGEHEIEWLASSFSSGVYFVSMFVNGEYLDSKKIVLLK